jgi:F0F1-type ATP synthase assembly protein I
LAKDPAPQTSKTELPVNILQIALEFAFIIGIPAIVFIEIGTYLDERWQTPPWMLLAGFFLALTVSAYTIYIRIRTISQLMDNKFPPK